MGRAGCAFCAIVAGEAPAHRIVETRELVGFLDIRPLFPGHVLLVPRVHAPILADLPVADIGPCFTTVQRVERAVVSALTADGSMVLVNNVVSQSVPHLHVHVIPRRSGDGLRLWLGPRRPYADEAAAADVAARIRTAYADGGGGVS